MNVSYDKAEFSVYMELRGQSVKYKIKRLCVHVCCGGRVVKKLGMNGIGGELTIFRAR